MVYPQTHAKLNYTAPSRYPDACGPTAAAAAAVQVVTELVHAADRSQSCLPDRRSELKLLQQTLTAKTDAEEKEEKKILDRDMDDIGEGSARGTVRGLSTWILCIVVLIVAASMLFPDFGPSDSQLPSVNLAICCAELS